MINNAYTVSVEAIGVQMQGNKIYWQLGPTVRTATRRVQINSGRYFSIRRMIEIAKPWFGNCEWVASGGVLIHVETGYTPLGWVVERPYHFGSIFCPQDCYLTELSRALISAHDGHERELSAIWFN